jgi:hypothetical protein
MAAEREQRDSAKIPIWMGNGKDQFTAEHWIKRLENAKASSGWTDLQTVNNAHSALRDKALTFRDYLESEGLNPDEWQSFRKHFLLQFGSAAVDHSKITNLSLSQKADEKSNAFGWRVNAMVNEFFTSVPLNTLDLTEPRFNTLPDQIVAACPDAGVRSLILAYVQQVASALHEQTRRSYSSSLGRVIFLNGLHANIRMVTKLKKTISLHEAVTAAMEAEKAHAGPSDRHIQAVEEGDTSAAEEPDVNYINRRKTHRPWGRSSGPPSSQASNYKKQVTAECWYCHKKGHLQLHCRLRLGRGAAVVTKPRTVQEIQLDRAAYQLGPEDEEEVNSDHSDSDESADIASLSVNHLN